MPRLESFRAFALSESSSRREPPPPPQAGRARLGDVEVDADAGRVRVPRTAYRDAAAAVTRSADADRADANETISIRTKARGCGDRLVVCLSYSCRGLSAGPQRRWAPSRWHRASPATSATCRHRPNGRGTLVRPSRDGVLSGTAAVRRAVKFTPPLGGSSLCGSGIERGPNADRSRGVRFVAVFQRTRHAPRASAGHGVGPSLVAVDRAAPPWRSAKPRREAEPVPVRRVAQTGNALDSGSAAPRARLEGDICEILSVALLPTHIQARKETPTRTRGDDASDGLRR